MNNHDDIRKSKGIDGFADICFGSSTQQPSLLWSHELHEQPYDQPRRSAAAVGRATTAVRSATVILRQTHTLPPEIFRYCNRIGRERKKRGTSGEATRGTVSMQRMGSQLQLERARRTDVALAASAAKIVQRCPRRWEVAPIAEIGQRSAWSQTNNEVPTFLHFSPEKILMFVNCVL